MFEVDKLVNLKSVFEWSPLAAVLVHTRHEWEGSSLSMFSRSFWEIILGSPTSKLHPQLVMSYKILSNFKHGHVVLTLIASCEHRR